MTRTRQAPRVCLRAYAKLNLGLVVGARRADGYHEVATALAAISLADRLDFAPRARGFSLRVDGPEGRGVPTDATNLVIRAAEALAAELGERRGAAIHLTKHVPHGAGLMAPRLKRGDLLARTLLLPPELGTALRAELQRRDAGGASGAPAVRLLTVGAEATRR